jgi:hypothetical protein
LSDGDDEGLYILIGPGSTVVRAPVAPGVVTPVEIREWRILKVGDSAEISLTPCTIALDGERTFTVLPRQEASVILSDRGPRVVEVDAALRQAARNGVFVDRASASA